MKELLIREEEILRALSAEAERRFGSERLSALQETLRQTAAELRQVCNYPLDPEDEP